MKLFIGWDSREVEAYNVAVHTLEEVSTLVPIPLEAGKLADSGLLRRPTDRRGQTYDLPSNAPCSTEFAISRFLTPILAQTGWALFVDCDVVFLADPRELMEYADPSKAVMVVQHDQQGGGTKMDGQVQTSYARKNQSSVCLYNCGHPANRRLSLQDVNERPGRDLHNFYWLAESEIGYLPGAWNWLVGEEPKPPEPKIAHFTLGTPNLTERLKDSEHADIWWDAYRRLCRK